MSGVTLTRLATDVVPAGCRLRPLRNQIVCKVLDLKLSKTLIANWSGNCVRGEIVAIGPGTFRNIHKRGEKDGKRFHKVWPGRYVPTVAQVGDIVHLGGMENRKGYDFPRVLMDNAEHVIASENDICGIESDD